jgi:hypothetical protein
MFLLWPRLGRRIPSLYRLRIPRRTAQLTVLNGDYAWIVTLDKVFSPGLTTARGILDSHELFNQTSPCGTQTTSGAYSGLGGIQVARLI